MDASYFELFETTKLDIDPIGEPISQMAVSTFTEWIPCNFSCR